MAKVRTVRGTPGRLASRAHAAVTKTEFDYFDSGSAAQAHAEAEGIDPELLDKSGSYTRAPRLYSADLKKKMTEAFRWLAAPGSHAFLHSYHGAVVLGRTVGYSGAGLELDVPSKGAPALRLDGCDSLAFSLNPPQNLSEPPHRSHSAPIQLSLGRNVIVGEYPDEDMDQALRDRNRDWERVLVVGDRAVEQYLELIMEEHQEASVQGEGLSQTAMGESLMTGAFLGSGLIEPLTEAA